MKKALIFTYYWPPSGGPGVQRYLKFVKYLRSFGYEPIVVAPANGSFPYLDPSLEKDIPEGIKIILTKAVEPFGIYNALRGQKGKSVDVGMAVAKGKPSLFQRFSVWVRANFFIPDARKGWVPGAVEAGMDLIRTEKPDIMITTGPPHSTHLIGLEIRRKHQIPWIADFRDPWNQVYYNRDLPRMDWAQQKDRKLESRVIRSADAVVIVNEGIGHKLASAPKRLELIYNGYDAEDFPPGEAVPTEQFTIRHMGYLDATSLAPEWVEAVRQLHEQEPGFSDDVVFEFIGKTGSNVPEAFKDAGIAHMLRLTPFIPHRDAVREMCRSCMLLLTIPIDPRNPNIVPGKVYEYMASRVPLLMLLPEGSEVEKLMSAIGRGHAFRYTDTEGVKEHLRSWYRNWKENGRRPYRYPEGQEKDFSRTALTSRLASLMDELMSRGK